MNDDLMIIPECARALIEQPYVEARKELTKEDQTRLGYKDGEMELLFIWSRGDGDRIGTVLTDGFFFQKEDGKVFINEYWWTEGNGDCDCNRSVMLAGADYSWASCGETLRLHSVVANADHDYVILEEGDY